ncbi:MAG: histidine phosphatase family protein [Candidatus Buchananbacteria bacterium]|nr:histidine phosphatase family protein [Candidatus Buchananbacteria bacterium]
MRHGQAGNNLDKVIVSEPKEGKAKFGLTRQGIDQVKKTIRQNKFLSGNFIIYHSDFKRTTQTAKLVSKTLGIRKVYKTPLLRERFFGQLNGTATKNFILVWRNDQKDIKHGYAGGESVNDVLSRTTKLVADLEKKYQDKNILLISHGDTIEILQAAFLKVDLLKRTKLVKHIKTAELRQLKFKSVA